MNMIRSHMCGEKVPGAMRTNRMESTHHDRSTVAIQAIRLLSICSRFYSDALCAGFRSWAFRRVVAPVHAAGFIAMQMQPIAGESDEVPHERTCR
jgi:hypothetical protein